MLYNGATQTWAAGPQLPAPLIVDDGPAAVLPDGNVLVVAAPYSSGGFCWPSPVSFFEFNGTSFVSVPASPNASHNETEQLSMLVLPTGQVLLTDWTIQSIEIYTPAGSPQSAWRPVITSVPNLLTTGATYTATGLQFNGVSQGSAYGDEQQNSTNYPLVQITNSSTGHVYYARTHNHSTMAIQTGSTPVSTQFDVPAGMETGPSSLVVIANGIASSPASVSVGVGDQGTMTQGLRPVVNLNNGNTTMYRGFNASLMGSYTPVALTGGATLAAFEDFGTCNSSCGPSTNSSIIVSGLHGDPGSSWLLSASANGVTLTGATASYGYSGGIANWTWSSTFGFTGSGTTPATITHR